jgi:hypothetical protein
MKVLGIFGRLIAQEGLVAEISSITFGSEDRSDFPGSPTILVNGEDLFPAERHSTRHELQGLRHPRRSEEPPDRDDGTRGACKTLVGQVFGGHRQISARP